MLIEALLAAAVPITPGFDCARAATAVETMICADPELAVRDRAMGMLYRRVPAIFTNIPRAQRRWLVERNRCRSRACLLGAYDKRIAQLASSASVSEYFRHESYVGGLTIAPVAGDWHVFSVGTAGHDANGAIITADAAGLIRMPGGAGRWRVSADCAIGIARSGTRWRVTQDRGCARAFKGLSLAGLYLTESDWWTAPDIEAAQPPRGKLSR